MLLAGPWLGPVWSSPLLELDHQRDAQILPACVVDQELDASSKPDGSGGGDLAVQSFPLEPPGVDGCSSIQAARAGSSTDRTRRLLISVHASSFL